MTTRKRPQSRTPWVVVDASCNKMRCLHCGESESMDMFIGKSLAYVATVMRAWTREHSKCRAPEKPD